MELNQMSLKELRETKTKWYEDAVNEGKTTKLAEIARCLGSRLNHSYGPKYKFIEGNIEIYVDDYGNYMTVHVGGKLKVSTHNEKLFACGEWEEIIDRLYPEVTNKKLITVNTHEQQERQKLLEELS